MRRLIVIGGGHAGIEASAAAARMGCDVIMITLSRNKIGEMSCNPAIGGVGKGQIVKEIDILGGIMAQAIDRTGIQFRKLNSSRGCSVISSRSQADRYLYQKWMQNRIETYCNIKILEDEVESICVKNNRVNGVETVRNGFIKADAVVVTTGTFLKGLMHQGEKKIQGGRYSEPPANNLSNNLLDLGFELIRLKTGTPPRLLKSSINFDGLIKVPPDKTIEPFSFWSRSVNLPQIDCYLTATNDSVHDIILKNRERSPIFNGQIQACGPRYCPSIEDKVFRFSNKTSHQIFLEPEGLDSDIIYPNGISTSLPIEVQDQFIRLIPGLSDVQIVRYGYAVEYDAIKPTQLKQSLEAKHIEGVFFAGQINGTSGYEEAAGQGIIAGINAALYLKGEPPFVLKRNEAYIAVMIDDLTSLGVEEPYRMFTSRVEYRLSIREDNAFVRLGEYAIKLGLLPEQKRITLEKALQSYHFLKSNANKLKVDISGESMNLEKAAKRADIEFKYGEYAFNFGVEEKVLRAVVNDIKLSGYLARQHREISWLERVESIKLPKELDYSQIPGLRREFVEKLSKIRPETLGQVARMPGVTPSTIVTLELYIKKKNESKQVSYC